MRCSACTRNLRSNAKFCGGCGINLLFGKNADSGTDVFLANIAAVTATMLVLGVLALFVLLVVALAALQASFEFIALIGAVFLISGALLLVAAGFGLTELFRAIYTPRPVSKSYSPVRQQNPPREPRFSVTEDTTLIMKQPSFYIRPQ